MAVLTKTATITHREELRRGRSLEYLTIGYNLFEAAVSIGAGMTAGSTALIGFGADSLIESTSGAALLWRLQEREHHEEHERLTLRLVGVSFLLLAGYVAMPWLARQKRRVAARINSMALQADSRQTCICAYLSAILLGSLLLNALFGWWWADPVAALVMVPIIGHEGIEALQGKHCEDGCAG